LAISDVNSKTGRLASSHKSLDGALQFNTFIQNKLEISIGTLVDVNMAKEAANQQAIQVKKQLGIQTLSLLTRNQNQILTLFGLG
jgi:flagellin